jgi:hypothetical protein
MRTYSVALRTSTAPHDAGPGAARRAVRRLRPVAVVAVAVAALVLTGCTGQGGTPAPGSAGPTTASAQVSPSGAQTGGGSPAASPEPSDPVSQSRVTYDWGVPSSEVTVTHTVGVPIATPPAPPLPYLVGVYVGDHPEGSPAYQRISFYFRGAFPSYRVKYVPAVLADGSGAPVPLTGNTFLSVVFVNAQAHDNAGASTVVASPHNPIGLPTLTSYAPAGDFEGHVSYGLGITSAAGSAGRPVRAGELRRADGAGGYFYVIYVDIRRS